MDETLSSVMAVLSKAMLIYPEFDTATARSRKSGKPKFVIIKQGLGQALRELENYPALKSQFEALVRDSANSTSRRSVKETDAHLAKSISKECARLKAKGDTSEFELCEADYTTVYQSLVHLSAIAVPPYVPEGISFASVEPWWKCRQWEQILKDTHYRSQRLNLYLRTIFDLAESSAQMRKATAHEFLTVHLAHTLLHSENNTALYGRFKEFVIGVDVEKLVHTATMLLNPNIMADWLDKSSRTLLGEAAGRGYLKEIMEAFKEQGRNTRCTNFLFNVSLFLLDGTGFSFKKEAYLESLVKQLFAMLEESARSNRSGQDYTATLFNTIIDMMNEQYNYFSKTLILNRLFSPLEDLATVNDAAVTDAVSTSMRQLTALLGRTSVESKTLTRSPRMAKAIEYAKCTLKIGKVVELEIAATRFMTVAFKPDEKTDFYSDEVLATYAAIRHVYDNHSGNASAMKHADAALKEMTHKFMGL